MLFVKVAESELFSFEFRNIAFINIILLFILRRAEMPKTVIHKGATMSLRSGLIEHAIAQHEGESKKKFGDILEDEVIPQAFGKRLLTGEEELLLEGNAIRKSFRRRIKRLGRKLSSVSKDEHPAITRQIDHMHGILALHPGKLIKLIKVTALLRNLRQKPEFLIGAAKLHIVHRRYGRKPVENAKKHIKKKMKR